MDLIYILKPSPFLIHDSFPKLAQELLFLVAIKRDFTIVWGLQ